MEGTEQWLTLAKVVRSRGRRGEVIAESLGAGPERFAGKRKVLLCPPTGEAMQVRVDEAWEHQGRLVLKFSGVDSITEAERWRGAEVRIPRSAREPLAEGEYLLDDLVGCRMVARGAGEEIGLVEAWQDAGGPVLLVVRNKKGQELLVPFARSICLEIDVAAKRIEAELPEGLRDLNQ